MIEKDVEKLLMLRASELGTILYKNNVGMMKDQFGNVIRFGLCKGSSDLIGWTPVTITEDMVGKTIAVFTAVEVKRDKFGPYGATDDQIHFINNVKRHGGMAGVADCNKDLEQIIKKR
jgi:hypothetical protein